MHDSNIVECDSSQPNNINKLKNNLFIPEHYVIINKSVLYYIVIG